MHQDGGALAGKLEEVDESGDILTKVSWKMRAWDDDDVLTKDVRVDSDWANGRENRLQSGHSNSVQKEIWENPTRRVEISVEARNDQFRKSEIRTVPKGLTEGKRGVA